MGCGCNGAEANAAAQWVIKFADGTLSKRFESESDARTALAKTGKTGIVRSVPR